MHSLVIPNVLVHKDSADDWQLANATGLALAQSQGHPRLEEATSLLIDTHSMRQYIDQLDLTAEEWAIYACNKSDCVWVRPYRPGSHRCVRPDGTIIPNAKGKGPRQCKKAEVVGTVTGFHDLPAKVKCEAWASFCSVGNRLDVDSRIFQWQEGLAEAPFPSKTAPHGRCPPPMDSPRYGSQPVTLLPKQQQSAAKRKRAERLKEISSSAAAGPSGSGGSGAADGEQEQAGPEKTTNRRA